MAKLTQCDRCKYTANGLLSHIPWFKVIVTEQHTTEEEKKYDLCGDCKRELVAFMTSIPNTEV